MYIVQITRSETATMSFSLSALNNEDAKKNAITMLQTAGKRHLIEWTPGPTNFETKIMKRTDAPDTPAFLEKKEHSGYPRKRRKINHEKERGTQF